MGFFEKQIQEKYYILPAAHGQLEKTNPGGSDMDYGHVGGSISKNKYKSCIEKSDFIELLDCFQKTTTIYKKLLLVGTT